MKDDMSDFYRGGAREISRPPALWTLAFLSFVLLNLFIFMGFDLLLPTLSLYLEGHGRSEAEVGRIFGTFTISAILMRMLASTLARRLEAVWLVRLGLLGCMLAGVWYFWADTVPAGMGARFLHGAGFGLASTLITALASQIIPPARMGEGLGYLGLGTTLALALGPFMGIWLVDEFGYLPMFLVAAAFYAVGIIMVSFLPRIKLASAAPGSPKPRLVLLSRRVAGPSFLMFLVGVIMSSVSIYMALFCREAGLPYAGHFFVLSTIGLFVARFTAGRIHDRLGPRYIMIPSGLMLLAAMLALYETQTRDLLFAASVIYGFATGAVFPSLQALALAAVPLSGRTEATAGLFNAFDLGMGAGSLSLGYLASQVGSYRMVYVGGAGASLALLMFYLVYYELIGRSKPKPAGGGW